MTCLDCFHEKFFVIKVYRNRRIKDGKWVANERIDTRIISCEKCGQRYLTTTIITHKIKYSNYRTFIEDLKDNSQIELNFDKDEL